VAVSISQFAAGEKAVWIDYYAYAARLLAGGRIPWLDATAFMAFHSKAQGLLKSGVIALPVEPVVRAVVAADAAIAETMRGKSRTTFPLRKLLEEPALRSALSGLLEPLRAAHAGRPLALLLPSPRAFLALAYGQAFGETADISEDDVSSAAVYLADLLREFASIGLDAVVLVESGVTSEADLAELEPVANKAQDYRWQLGLLDAARVAPLPAASRIDFLISAALPASAPGGRMLAYGAGAAPTVPPRGAGQFRYVVLDAEAQPEALLGWLAGLA
jgi:hypothetical protein